MRWRRASSTTHSVKRRGGFGPPATDALPPARARSAAHDARLTSAAGAGAGVRVREWGRGRGSVRAWCPAPASDWARCQVQAEALASASVRALVQASPASGPGSSPRAASVAALVLAQPACPSLAWSVPGQQVRRAWVRWSARSPEPVPERARVWLRERERARVRWSWVPVLELASSPVVLLACRSWAAALAQVLAWSPVPAQFPASALASVRVSPPGRCSSAAPAVRAPVRVCSSEPEPVPGHSLVPARAQVQAPACSCRRPAARRGRRECRPPRHPAHRPCCPESAAQTPALACRTARHPPRSWAHSAGR